MKGFDGQGYKEDDRWTRFGHGSDTAQDTRHDTDTFSRSIRVWRQDRSIVSRLPDLSNRARTHLHPQRDQREKRCCLSNTAGAAAWMITLEIIQAAGAVCDGQQRFSGWEFGGDRCVRRVQVLPESGAMWRLSRKGATQSHSPEATLEIGVSVVSKHIRATYRESPNPVPATQSSRGVKASKAAASKP